MFIPVFLIRIGNQEYRQVHGVRVERSWQTLGDTAVIEIGDAGHKLRNQVSRGKGIKAGDAVSIELGYGSDKNLHLEFTGFVVRVDASIPIRVECEDNTYLLRQMMVGREFPGGNLLKLLDFLAMDTPYKFNVKSDVPDLKFGRHFLDYTVADAINRFRKNYGLVAYWRGNTLFMGLRYGEKPGGEVVYRTDTNVINLDLQWREYNAEKVRAIALGTDDEGKTVTVFVGRKDAKERVRLVFPGVTDKGDLEDMARSELKKINYQGYEGSITCFGTPYCDHGWVVQLVDADFPNRNGRYYAEKVVVTSGVGGYRRVVYLGQDADWEPNDAQDGSAQL